MTAADTDRAGAAAQVRAGLMALSDSERLLIASLRAIALGLAQATCGMSERDTERHVDEAIFELIQSLGETSEPFAAETERYLRVAVQRARAH